MRPPHPILLATHLAQEHNRGTTFKEFLLMKLYYAPGACSLACHIVLEETGAPYEVEQVNLKNKTCTSGDYWQINPKGSVPALRLDDGQILSEGVVINQYIADQYPDKNLAPRAGTMERYRLMELLNHIATDLHKSYSPLFFAGRLVKDEATQNELRGNVREMVAPRLTGMNALLAGKSYLMGEDFTVADAYFYTVMTWNKSVGIDTSKWGNISAFMTRMEKRPAVQRALKAEGLLK